MPCYEVRRVTVEFKAANKSLLLTALKAAGHKYSVNGNTVATAGGIVIDLANQTATGGNSTMLNKLKQAYSREAVKATAKKFGWATKTQGNTINVTKMQW